MSSLWIVIVNLVKELIKPISVLVGSFLLFKQGKEASSKDALEKQVKDAKEAQATKNRVTNSSSDNVKHILQPNTKRKPTSTK